MSDDESRELVLNWFQRRASDPEHMPFAKPRVEGALADVIARRDASPASLTAAAGAVSELPVPPQYLIDWVGGGDAHVFQTVGLLNTYQLMVYCGLRPESRVLEPGCGCGRNARYVVPYLDPAVGSFAGFDIHREGIDWATETISGPYPNARFTFADIQNSNYNPEGAERDATYRFPYEDGSFDVVYLPSVFTHLTRTGFEQYAREIARVLVPGGRLLGWHFLLNERTQAHLAAGDSVLPLAPYDDVSWAMDPENPCAAIGFHEDYVLDVLESHGLQSQRILRGSWSGGRPDGIVDAQDRILAVRA